MFFFFFFFLSLLPAWRPTLPAMKLKTLPAPPRRTPPPEPSQASPARALATRASRSTCIAGSRRGGDHKGWSLLTVKKHLIPNRLYCFAGVYVKGFVILLQKKTSKASSLFPFFFLTQPFATFLFSLSLVADSITTAKPLIQFSVFSRLLTKAGPSPHLASWS